MKKFLTKRFLAEHGWTGIDVGKGYVVSHCITCNGQKIHHCTGKKDDQGETIFRLDCDICNEKINGGNNYGRRNNGSIS